MIPSRVGGPIKPLQHWSSLLALDLRSGQVRQAKLPADMASKYRKITAPVYVVWSDFGSFEEWPHSDGDWSEANFLVTAAKIKTYCPLDELNSGRSQMVGLLNAGPKQIGKLKTYYLLTGAYTDDKIDEHNVARMIPMSPLEPGARATIISLRQDGRHYVAPPKRGETILPTMNFQEDFLEKLDLRVGRVRSVTSDLPVHDASEESTSQGQDTPSIILAVEFGTGELITRAPLSILRLTPDIVGRVVVGMVNIESDGNEFVMLGFFLEDGTAVPLSCDELGPDLPPNASHVA